MVSQDALDHLDDDQPSLPFPEDFDDFDSTVASHGYDPRSTPIDTLMSAQGAMPFDVADYMENPDD